MKIRTLLAVLAIPFLHPTARAESPAEKAAHKPPEFRQTEQTVSASRSPATAPDALGRVL